MEDNPQVSSTPSTATAPPGAAAPVAPVAYPRSDMTGVSQDEKTQAMLMWILSLFIGFISPLIFLLIGKDKPYVYKQSARALTFCIALIVLWVACFMLSIAMVAMGVFPIMGFLFPLIGLAALVVVIMGAVAASKGEDYSPPVIGGLAKSLFKV